jgi:hypothetical protein
VRFALSKHTRSHFRDTFFSRAMLLFPSLPQKIEGAQDAGGDIDGNLGIQTRRCSMEAFEAATLTSGPEIDGVQTGS